MSYLGLVKANPHYGLLCRLRRHERKMFPLTLVQGGATLWVPWCQTCRLNDARRVAALTSPGVSAGLAAGATVDG